MKRILFILTMVVASCSSIQVSYDLDKTVDFTKYKTYSFTPEALKLPVSDLDRDRILKAVEVELAGRGITKSETPDAWVDLIIKAQEKTEATATNSGGYGYGRYGYGGGFSTTTINYNTYVEGTLFINLVDKPTEKIVWQGRGTRTLDKNASAEKKETNINYSVKSIFYNYPVKPKK